VTSGDSERPEEQAGEKVCRVSSKQIPIGTAGRQVVERRETETQARGESDGVIGKSVAGLRGRRLQPKRRAIAGQ
jgi:hypothetical protein